MATDTDQRRDDLLGVLLAPALWDRFAQDIVASLWPELEAEAREGMALVRGSLNGHGASVAWQSVEDQLHQWAVAHATELAVQLNGTSQEYVRQAVEAWLKDGAKAPLDSYLNRLDAPSRQDLIASDQRTAAYREGVFAAASKVGVKTYIWSGQLDSCECKACLSYEGHKGTRDDLQEIMDTVHNGSSAGCRCVAVPDFLSIS